MSVSERLATAVPTAGRSIVWQPQPGPQTDLLMVPEDVPIVVLGGAKGGGKTDGMIGDFLDHAMKHGKHAEGVFFRRHHRNLEGVVKRTMQLFPQLGGEWNGGKSIWTFVRGPARGATLKMRHLRNVEDAASYAGQPFSWICCEELTTWSSPQPIDMMFSCLRSAAGIPVRFRATCNPGYVGHAWVKHRYITPSRNGYKICTDAQTGLRFVFIPSRLQDNPALLQSDPDYPQRLRASGSEELVRAWLEGDWDIVAGGFFDDVWVPDRQLLPPGWQLPKNKRVLWRRSFDWGSAKPSSLGIWAIPLEDIEPSSENPGPYIPRGSVIRLDEWYTIKRMSGTHMFVPNTGQRLTNAELGRGIARRSIGRTWHGCVADPSIFTEQGGPSIYAQLRLESEKAAHVLRFNKADNDRLAGWSKMRDMMHASAQERAEEAGLFVHPRCQHFTRTVPVMVRDEDHPDDLDTEQEDHIADETRYLCMSLKSARRASLQIVGGY